MALFGRKSQPASAAPAIGLAAPVAVLAGDVDRVRSLMAQFNQGVGNGARLRSFGIDFNRAGGFISDMNTMDAMQVNREATNRPWFWLAAVARAALAEGDRLLVAQVAYMTRYWDVEIAPQLGPADWFDGIVDTPSERARAEIYSVAVEALPGLPADTEVMANTTGSVSAAAVLVMSAGEALRVESFLAPEVVAVARRTLGR